MPPYLLDPTVNPKRFRPIIIVPAKPPPNPQYKEPSRPGKGDLIHDPRGMRNGVILWVQRKDGDVTVVYKLFDEGTPTEVEDYELEYMYRARNGKAIWRLL